MEKGICPTLHVNWCCWFILQESCDTGARHCMHTEGPRAAITQQDLISCSPDPCFFPFFTSPIPPRSLPEPTSRLWRELPALSFTHSCTESKSATFLRKPRRQEGSFRSNKSRLIEQSYPKTSSCCQLSGEDKMGLCCPLLVGKKLTYQKTTK